MINILQLLRGQSVFVTSPPFDSGPPPEPLSIGALYERVAPAQAVVSTLAKGVSRSHFRVVYNTAVGPVGVADGILETALNDPLLKLGLASDYAIYGRCFAAIAGGRVIVRLPADTTEVIAEGLQVVGYRNNGNEYSVEEVAALINYSPLTSKLVVGASPLEAARPELEEYLHAYREAKALSSGSSVVVKRPLDAPEWSPEAAERFENGWSSRLKTGGSPVLEDGMTPETIQRPQGFVEARRMVFDAVCSIFSVPGAMVTAANSDRNQDAAQRSFAVDAVQPIGDLLASAFTKIAVPAFYSETNPDGVHAIKVLCDTSDSQRDRYAQRITAYRAAIGNGGDEAAIFTVDEVRALEGYGPISGQGAAPRGPSRSRGL